MELTDNAKLILTGNLYKHFNKAMKAFEITPEELEEDYGKPFDELRALAVDGLYHELLKAKPERIIVDGHQYEGVCISRSFSGGGGTCNLLDKDKVMTPPELYFIGKEMKDSPAVEILDKLFGNVEYMNGECIGIYCDYVKGYELFALNDGQLFDVTFIELCFGVVPLMTRYGDPVLDVEKISVDTESGDDPIEYFTELCSVK